MPLDPHRDIFPAHVLRRFPRLAAGYFSVDPRSLGAARIGVACLLLYDLLRRVPGLETWYTNDGLLPNHTVLWRPGSQWMLSFFFAASWANEVRLLFALCGFIYLALLVGYRTRLFHALSLICVISLHTRVVFLENGGDVALNILCAWTLFLPMGARFSADAVKRSLNARREQRAVELNDREPLAPDPRPVVSLAVLGVLLQLAVIYYFNAVSKTGSTWRHGSAVHYVLQQERMVTWLGWKLRALSSLPLSRFATYCTLVVESAAAALILSPFYRVYARRAAVVLIPGLHLAFALLLNVGMFSFNMMGYFPLLLSAPDWALLARWFGPSPSRARTVYVDEASPLCFGLSRLLARLDRFARLTFVPLDPKETSFAYTTEAPSGAGRATGWQAITETIAALPCGFLPAKVLWLPGVRALGGWVWGAASGRRARIDAWLADRSVSQERSARPPSWLQRRVAELREAMVAVLFVALGSQVLMENKVVPAVLKLGQANWMKQLVVYPRLFQGWSMFTPDAPMGERMLYVDAVTIGGRHVDPFNEAGSRVAELPVTRIPPFMNQDEFWCDYTNRIPDNGAYHGPLKEWISSYHRRTGRAEDRVISYEVFLVESDSPPPGEYGPRNIRTRSMLRDRDKD